MTERPVERPAHDEGWRADRRVLVVTASVAAGTFGLGSAVQAAYIYAAVAPGWSAVDAWSRILANLLAVVAFLGVLLLWRQYRRSDLRDLVIGGVLAALVAAVTRVVIQVPLGVYTDYAATTTTAELASGFGVCLVSATFATWAMLSRRRLRAQAQAAERLAVERALAIRALEEEEIRVRRDVAEGLHASVQQRLVVVVAQTAEVARRLRAGAAGPSDAGVLEQVCAALDEVREQDVRGMSRLLYPDQLEVGLVPAVRALLRRVPSSVATQLDVDPVVREMDDPVSPTLAATERLLAVRVVEEGIANALRHGHPTSLTVTLRIVDGILAVGVDDDGCGVSGDAVRSGTSRLAERLAVVGGTLELVGVDGEGTRLVGRLPVARAVSGV
jgi:signal transduction histidine kinase